MIKSFSPLEGAFFCSGSIKSAKSAHGATKPAGAAG